MRPDAVHAVIAVKNLDRAKSRLADRVPDPQRARLVLAMLSDTVRAALAAGLGSVTVVTPDSVVAETVRGLGARVHPDPAASPGTADARASGLNTALAAAASAVRERFGAVDLLFLQADLPAVRAQEVRAMLAAAPAAGRALVVDHTGRGTAALLIRGADTELTTRFGPDSARLHRESGAIAIAGNWPGLRLDVDTAADLDRAIALGLGAASADLLARIDWTVDVNTQFIGGVPARRVCAG
ncbi:MAG: 2-phospho-L-lactate guanylyltransferase [Nocardia sp.]|nr:2-phospho-L-lactate guanylyltransferase [Nocardia sp.]